MVALPEKADAGRPRPRHALSAAGSDNDVHVRVVRGDADNSSLVNILDQSYVKARLFKSVTAELVPGEPNLRADMRTDGIINILDQSDVKAQLFKGALSCP